MRSINNYNISYEDPTWVTPNEMNSLRENDKEYLMNNMILDKHIRLREGSFNILLGHPSSGKTFFTEWYFSQLITKHKIKLAIFTGENTPKQYRKELSSFILKGSKEETNVIEWIDERVSFVSNNKNYNILDVIDLFKTRVEVNKENGYMTICLIDPQTSMIAPGNVNEFVWNKNVCNKVRKFVQQSGCAIFLSIHPNTAAQKLVHSKDHIHAMLLKPPLGADASGGIWRNFCDNLYIIHRYYDHESENEQRIIRIWVDKIKYSDTGVTNTSKNAPIKLEFNKSDFSFNTFYDKLMETGGDIQAQKLKRFEETKSPF